jgi:type I restriction enzyme R subunit
VSAPQPRSDNFGFLAAHDPELVRLGADAERFFALDPDVSLVRLRQLGEQIAQRTAAMAGLAVPERESQNDLLRRLQDGRLLTPEVRQLFHGLRLSGNSATHALQGKRRGRADEGQEAAQAPAVERRSARLPVPRSPVRRCRLASTW